LSIYLKTALEYAERGWSIIPIGRDKKATGEWKRFQSERPTQDELERLFGGNGVQGLAVVCGPVSGNLVCRDFDLAGAYEAWAKEHPEMAAMLPTVKTGRGHHVYVRSRECTKIEKLGDGELRGGGYCILPPSKHESGRLYEWIVPPPDGDFPEVDPVKIGLVPVLQRRQKTTETTEAIPSALSALSVLSITPAIESEIRQAILRTLPQHEGKREGLVFKFARALKAIPVVADLPAASCRQFVRSEKKIKWNRLINPSVFIKIFTIRRYGEIITGINTR